MEQVIQSALDPFVQIHSGFCYTEYLLIQQPNSAHVGDITSFRITQLTVLNWFLCRTRKSIVDNLPSVSSWKSCLHIRLVLQAKKRTITGKLFQVKQIHTSIIILKPLPWSIGEDTMSHISTDFCCSMSCQYFLRKQIPSSTPSGTSRFNKLK